MQALSRKFGKPKKPATNKIPVRSLALKPAPLVKAGKFIIRKLSEVVGETNLFHPLHRHDYYFILAVEKGSGLHEIDFVKYQVTGNSVFLLRPGQVHQLSLTAGCTGYLLEFDTSFYRAAGSITEQRFKKAVAKNFCEISSSAFSQMLFNLSQAYIEYTNRDDGYPEAISACLDLFMIAYLRQSSGRPSPEPPSTQYVQQRFEEFMQALETGIHTDKTVAGYAKLLNLSVYQVNSLTKAASGKTASGLINEQVILEAKRHLLGTTAQVKDIAGHLGYEDVSYFVRYFKKHTGQSPDAFRHNFK